MDIHSLLQDNCAKLLEQYNANLDSVLSLQATLIDDILPGVEVELDLDSEGLRWAKEWLEDTSCLFQIFRRHRFTRSFAIESMRENLIWRFTVLRNHLTRPLPRKYHILPNPDRFGRPIVVFKVSDLKDIAKNVKEQLMYTMDCLRAHLKSLNDDRSHDHNATHPVLQYVVLLDLSGLSIQNINVDLISWTIRELIPRFPGMLAAVFMINYSWAHSGIWTVVSRVLPTAALSRVLFPSQQELLHYFTPSTLPEEYGGTLPPLANPEAPSRAPRANIYPQNLTNGSAQLQSSGSHPESTLPARRSLSPTSTLNPFFGYPVSPTAPHSFYTGRRRKRDLLRTLARLWWVRWRSHLSFYMWVLVLALSIWAWVRRLGRARAGAGPDIWRSFITGFVL